MPSFDIRLAALLVALVLQACDCAGPRLSIRHDEDGGVMTAESFCGNGFVEEPFEECDFGLEDNVGGPAGTCNPDCTLSRVCPPGQRYEPSRVLCVVVADAGQADAGAVDAGAPLVDGGSGAFIEGTLWHETPFMPAAVAPKRPIAGAVARLTNEARTVTFGSVTTGPDGRFRFAISPGVAYAVSYEVPPQFYAEPDYARRLLPARPGETLNADYAFFLKGIHYRVGESGTNVPLEAVSVTVESAGRVLVGPVLTNSHGYVHLMNSPMPGVLIFRKQGYDPFTAVENPMHQLLGGLVLQRRQ